MTSDSNSPHVKLNGNSFVECDDLIDARLKNDGRYQTNSNQSQVAAKHRLSGSAELTPLGQAPLGAIAPAAQPKRPLRLAAGGKAGRRLAPQTTTPSSLVRREVRRQILEVGAVCGNAARTDLSGRRPVMGVPTGN